MKKITVVYDDRQRPSDEIREITGTKSFGRIIYRRHSLKERFISEASDAAEREKLDVKLSFIDAAAYQDTDGMDMRRAFLLVFSDCVIKNPQEFSLLVRKTGYCEEDFRIMAGDSVAAVIYHDGVAFARAVQKEGGEMKSLAGELDEIVSGAFYSIAAKGDFLSFITGGFDSRYFNALSGDEYTVIKSSSNKEKILAEYRFYYLLPDNMRSWFVLPYDLKDEGDKASYRMQRYHMTDLAIRYVHGAISTGEFKKILDILFVFLKERNKKTVTWNEFYEKRQELYITKVEKRIEELKGQEAFKEIESYISSGTAYSGIDEILKKYEDIYDSMIGRNPEELISVVSHGDLCFSNILYSPDAGLLRLIDPKGAQKEEELYSDPLYDIAKLSHSVSGCYDFMNSGLYEIDVEEDMKLKLSIDGDVREYRRMFENKLKEEKVDVRMLRLFECSLFLSMLPLHTDRPQKVLAFILNAIDIMNELVE
ncbi:MAG: aminoglycoside phosphotransferase family protein [Lachnospiraceae bacterium]|nr:aminoglycoside phosphotransferase family protein [Lachnospiraceae bacterium]